VSVSPPAPRTSSGRRLRSGAPVPIRAHFAELHPDLLRASASPREIQGSCPSAKPFIATPKTPTVCTPTSAVPLRKRSVHESARIPTNAGHRCNPPPTSARLRVAERVSVSPLRALRAERKRAMAALICTSLQSHFQPVPITTPSVRASSPNGLQSHFQPVPITALSTRPLYEPLPSAWAK
jgi:hypothetical protein